MLELAKKVSARFAEEGGRALAVGGFVRDSVLGLPSKDIDLEVYKIPIDRIPVILGEFGDVKIVGESFGVFKLDNILDVSVPRRENKVGRGHKAFSVSADPDMSYAEAALRRDFTINSMSKDLLTDELIDPHGGMSDLYNNVLRHTSPHFVEDPLRALRGMQFCSRFNLRATPETIRLCQLLRSEFDTLSKERIWGEFEKWSLSGSPSLGLDFLHDVGWTSLFPHLGEMWGVEQDPEWHPEKLLETHVKCVCDEAAYCAMYTAENFNLSREDSIVLVLAALLHDVGKPKVTVRNKAGRLISPRHAEVGVPLAEEFLTFINCPHDIRDKVLELVRLHMWHLGGISAKKARRLIHKELVHNHHNMLWMLMLADHSGRPPLPKTFPESAQRLRELVLEELKKNPRVTPHVMGRDLIELGWAPGVEMGVELKRLYNLQIDQGLSREELLRKVKKCA